MILPVTLCFAAAAAIVNIWLAIRIGSMRGAAKVSVGDGGDERLMRRMRAQANFIEQTPFTLALVAAVEIAGYGGQWLGPLAAVFIAGRICHAFGMDGNFGAGRPIGMLTSMLSQIVLAVFAVLITLGQI